MIIRNSGDSIGLIGFGGHFPMSLEAKDSTQNWKPIEKPFFFIGETGLNYILLPPNEIAITTVPVFKGNYSTDLRIKFGSSFSNIIHGTINYNQFESIHDQKSN